MSLLLQRYLAAGVGKHLLQLLHLRGLLGLKALKLSLQFQKLVLLGLVTEHLVVALDDCAHFVDFVASGEDLLVAHVYLF